MNIKYRVTLTETERAELLQIIKTGSSKAYKTRHAQILLATDEIPENAHWSDKTIAIAYHVAERTVGNVRRLLNRRASFLSIEDLGQRIIGFIDYYNRFLKKPFKWNYKGKILKV